MVFVTLALVLTMTLVLPVALVLIVALVLPVDVLAVLAVNVLHLAVIVMLAFCHPGRMMLLDPVAIMANPPVRIVPMMTLVVVAIAIHIVGSTFAAERPLILPLQISSGCGMARVEIFPIVDAD